MKKFCIGDIEIKSVKKHIFIVWGGVSECLLEVQNRCVKEFL